MVNWVRVSCVSGPPVEAGSDGLYPATVRRIRAGWLDALEQVVPDQPDIIVLPEYCDAPSAPAGVDGCTARSKYYRALGDEMRDVFAEVAASANCYIAYAALRTDAQERMWNSTQLLGRDGAVVGVYDKNYVTVEENARGELSYGSAARVFDLDFGRVGCVICFDLNFAELRERYVRQRPDLMLFSSVWHGGYLQRHWAYSTQAYFASSIRWPLASAVLSPVGDVVASSSNYHSYVTTQINLDRAVFEVAEKSKLAAVKQRYGKGVTLRDPGLIGSVLLTSEMSDVTVAQIIEEFDLEVLDDLLARSCRRRAEFIGSERAVSDET